MITFSLSKNSRYSHPFRTCPHHDGCPVRNGRLLCGEQYKHSNRLVSVRGGPGPRGIPIPMYSAPFKKFGSFLCGLARIGAKHIGAP